MSEEPCQCGFGEEYFTIEGDKSFCTVCSGQIVGSQGPVVDEPTKQQGAKIILVDDQPFFRQKIREFLFKHGHQILEAGEGLEAVRLLAQSLEHSARKRSERVDVVILDLAMPGLIDGFQTLGVVKAMDENLPVVILTSGPPTPELLQKLGQLKARKYLNKSSKNLDEFLLKNIETLT
jgi:twitching motility two-component system response regulator PilH